MDDGEKLFTKTSIPIRCGPSTALHGGGNTGAQYAADNSRLAGRRENNGFQSIATAKCRHNLYFYIYKLLAIP